MVRVLCVLMLVLVGCDPIWSIRNPATTTGQIDATCIEAGLRRWAPVVGHPRDTQPGVVEFDVAAVATWPEQLRVVWDTRRNELWLAIWKLGPHADRKVLSEYRAVREDVAAHIGAACGTPVVLGPERCIRCD